jgi:hypothetical protein
MNPFFYSKCNDNNKSHHEIYIHNHHTNKSNQHLQVIKCHNCNSQWKEIWTIGMIDAIVENNPTKENRASEVNPAVA